MSLLQSLLYFFPELTYHPETTDGGSGSFKWPVQTYDFELEDSNVFFLWLFEGSASQQGNTSATQLSSSFFNITAESEDTTSSKVVESTTAATRSTSEAASSKTSVPTTIDNEVPTETGTEGGGSLKEPSTLPTPTSKPDGASDGSQNEGSGELSVAAKAGIGAGVGVVGVTCISCTFLLWGYLRKKKATMAPPQELSSNMANGHGQWQTPPPYWKAYPLQEVQGSTYYGSQHSEPVELGPGRF